MKRLLLAIGVASLTVTLHAQSATPVNWESERGDGSRPGWNGQEDLEEVMSRNEN